MANIKVPSNIWLAGLLAAGISAIANLIIYYIGKAADVEYIADQNGEEMTVTAVMPPAGTIAAILAGTLLLFILKNRASGVKIWTIIVVTLGLFSLLSPLINAHSAGTKFTLSLMHIVALVITVYILRKSVEQDKTAA